MPPPPTPARTVHGPPAPADPRTMLTPQRDSGLAQFLAADWPTAADVEGGLHEYVLCAMEHGERVRAWCSELTAVLAEVPPTPAIHRALASPRLITLLPFARVPSATSPAPAGPLLPPPLVPMSFLGALRRSQVIDALVRLSRDDRPVDCEALVVELCLEYIGRRWRTGAGGEALADGISRKLAEIEFEATLQGHPPAVRTAIAPVLQRVRLHLGLVAPAQLVAKLNTLGAGPSPPFAPSQIIAAWLEIRLRAGANSHAVLDALRPAAPRVVRAAHIDALHGVLRGMGLLQQFTAESASADHTPTVERRIRTLSSLLTPRTPRTPRTHRTPKWFSHAQALRRTSSSVSQACLANAPRRPSLPVISSPRAPPSPLAALSSSPTARTFLDHLTSRSSASSTLVGEAARHESLPPHEADDRSAPPLLTHLVEMRYLTHRHEHTWFLGGGKDHAARLLSYIEDRLGACQDEELLRAEIAHLRSTFRIPPAQAAQAPGVETPCIQVGVGEAGAERLSGETLHDREASFDLEQYLADISLPAHPQGREATWSSSACSLPDQVEEVLEKETEGEKEMERGGSPSEGGGESESDAVSELDSAPGSVSRLSTYTIRHAVRGETRAVEVHLLPGREATTGGEAGRGRTASSPAVDRCSKETYTPLPPKISLRRSRKNLTLSNPSPAYLHQTAPPELDIGLSLRADVADLRAVRHPDTPPYTPTPSTPSSASHDTRAGRASYATSMLLTPVLGGSPALEGADGRSRRRMHRQCVIYDGEQVSPSGWAAAGAGVFRIDESEGEGEGALGRGPGVWDKQEGNNIRSVPRGRSSFGRVLFPRPLSPCRQAGSTPEYSKQNSPGASRTPSPAPAHPSRTSVPLASILSLFHPHPPRTLHPAEVEHSLAGFVEHERGRVLLDGGEWDAEARCRVVWVIEQVARLLDQPEYLEAISNVVASLSSSAASSPVPLPIKHLPSPMPMPPRHVGRLAGGSRHALGGALYPWDGVAGQVQDEGQDGGVLEWRDRKAWEAGIPSAVLAD